MADHAKLSASGAKRWLACPPSANLELNFPEETSEYAAEGTLAHELAEIKVRGYLEKTTKRTLNTKINKLKKDPLWNDEMIGCTDLYMEHIEGIILAAKNRPTVDLEQRVDFSDIVPGGFGTADCIIVQDHRLDIVDYKHGKGVAVSAEDNDQLKLYAWGAFVKYKAFAEIHTIGLHIVQPRNGGISSGDIDIMDLAIWANNTVAPRAKLADAGLGDFCPGDHCGFCRAAATCRARAEQIDAIVRNDLFEVLPPLITNEQVGEMLLTLEKVTKYKSALESYARKTMLNGEEIQGWKMVAGRNSRVWTDQIAAFAELEKQGIDQAMLYERVPLTVAKVEGQLGKKKFAEMAADIVSLVPGAPTMAKESDKRAAINQAQNDFKEFIPQEEQQ